MAALGPINYSSPVNFFIPQKIPDQVPDELKPVFSQLYNSMQQIILALINNCGIGPQIASDWPQLNGLPATVLQNNMGRFYAQAVEDIPFGAAINLVDSGAGIVNLRNANATNNTRSCHGFCSTSAGIPNGAIGEVILGSGTASIGGLTPGTNYWLSTSNGQIVNGRPVAAGNIEQYVGVALTTNILYFNVSGYIQH